MNARALSPFAASAPPQSVRDVALEAEQVILGAVLNDTARVHELPHLRPEYFLLPLHGRIWELIADAVRSGAEASPTLLAGWLGTDPDLSDAGGFRYVFDLFDKASPWTCARPYADAIIDGWLRRAMSQLCRDASAAAYDDTAAPAAAILGALREGVEQLERQAEPEETLTAAPVAADALFDELDAEAAEGRAVGAMTGLQCVDRRLRGLRPGRLVVIGGRPGVGKTALARGLAYGCATRNPDQLVLFHSLEMSRRELTERALAEASHMAGNGIAYADIGPDLTQQDRAFMRSLRSKLPANLLIDDRSSLSVDDVRRRVWSLKAQGRSVAAVFIDYLQLMYRPLARGRNDAAIIGEMTQSLKRLARETGICVVLLSQLSRQVEQRDDKRPQLSDLRESGSIEQDADAVLFPFREVYYLQKAEPQPGTTEHRQWEENCQLLLRRMDVHAAKVRQGAEGRDRQSFLVEYDHIEDVGEAWS